MALLTEKGWNKLSNQAEVKEGELQALFNMIDRDGSGELSLEEARKACKLIQARFNISEVTNEMIFILKRRQYIINLRFLRRLMTG